jgi:hypothetical protein
MTMSLARALMTLAVRSLGEGRREWARAMQAEFQAALDDGRPLAFAAGCLIAAWRQLPTQERGRLHLASHAVALGVLIPMAVVQLECVAGVPYSSLGSVAPCPAQELILGDAYRAATPSFLGLWLLLGLGHLRLAWVLLERDWARLVRVAAVTVAASATLVIFTVVLFLDDAGVSVQAGLLGFELAAIYALARWDARLSPDAWSGSFDS